ncbi:flagellar motor switch protein FliN/FliY [Paraperlucidibaca baekdonensis]|uniref:Flagellar motor switch protein FliN n=1 Tax=Paraperlucidibaca baekdonensis TaxID=748120 RepID=A0A3E0H1T0_9GAMM|nr:flagellar motor switch protein FliN [Paraperlucidibaca baekdonensis]REH36721.1 flagellar motor switch protein FliN/FliY [Paraperlucidibaca baekdonensis]
MSEHEIPDNDEVQAAAFGELQSQPAAASASAPNVNLDMILDVNVTVSIEVGRARMSISDLLKLSQGAIIELDRMAGEPLDVLVNGTLVARGEIVVVKDKFGIMLTEVVSPEERVRRLH